MSRGSPARRDAPQPDAPTPTAFDKIGRAIAMWREERGVTQTRLADAAGLHRSQMSRYERARELPNLKALEKILAALEVAPEDFFHYLGKLADISGPPTRPLSNRVEAGEIAVAFQRMHAAIDDVRRLVETTVGPALRYREPIEEPTPSRGLPAGAAPGLATPSLEPESPPTESHTSPTLAVRRRARPAGTADAHSTGCGAEPPAPSSAERAPHPPEILKQLPLTPPAGLGLYRRQDYAGLPEGPRCELIRGRLYERPTISADEALVVQVFKTHLDRLANSVRGMVFRIPLAVVLADHSVVQPDLVYLSGSRRGLVQDWIEGEPDIL
ncbi:MAG TPA: helix-turn-helix domain-containing protein, partial [Thermoanaerobaculia bacterium]|nr:helix-turn-helix domain-containing protein [Thermoanaerobaculia bacterium]